MKILILAPQPFFIERGTPIAVRLLAEQLSTLSGNELPKLSTTLLTYGGGSDLHIPGVIHERIATFPSLQAVSPGISIKKVICDLLLAMKALLVVWSARKDQYTLIHAVEESVFIALLIKYLFRIPYVYDMDSCLSHQVIEKWSLLSPLSRFLLWCERWAIRESVAVVAVCESVATVAREIAHPQVHILTDISLLSLFPRTDLSPRLLERLKLPADAKLLIYIGNLEYYQGIDLLLQSFVYVVSEERTAHIVIVGGREEHITHYKAEAERLCISSRVHFIGSAPLAQLGAYMAEADILLSPRISGTNTPMKIYSYLDSGKPLVATKLLTHTQVLNEQVAFLAEPSAPEFGKELLKVLNDTQLRERVGAEAKKLADNRYTTTHYREKLLEIYRAISRTLSPV